ncbi:MAG: hypothetical protein JNM06_06530 [Blastocatellia bacterium]|nr:hypothetical protein [Blastocatellia bacterium]
MSKQNIEEKEVSQFWKGNELEELIKQQGVKPINNLDEVASKWPADDDPELLLSFILEERALQRNITNSEKRS